MARVDMSDDGLRVERKIDALAQIYDDIQLNVVPSTDKVVISMSWGVDILDRDDSEKKYTAAYSATFSYLLKNLIDTGIVVPVVAAGQDASSDTETVSPIVNNRDFSYADSCLQETKLYPALLGKDLPLLTVVGGVTVAGDAFEGGFNANWIRVYGPAEDLQCAQIGGIVNQIDGTSCGKSTHHPSLNE